MIWAEILIILKTAGLKDRVIKGTSNNYQLIHLKMKLEKNSEIFKSISYRYKFLVGARDPININHVILMNYEAIDTSSASLVAIVSIESSRVLKPLRDPSNGLTSRRSSKVVS